MLLLFCCLCCLCCCWLCCCRCCCCCCCCFVIGVVVDVVVLLMLILSILLLFLLFCCFVVVACLVFIFVAVGLPENTQRKNNKLINNFFQCFIFFLFPFLILSLSLFFNIFLPSSPFFLVLLSFVFFSFPCLFFVFSFFFFLLLLPVKEADNKNRVGGKDINKKQSSKTKEEKQKIRENVDNEVNHQSLEYDH